MTPCVRCSIVIALVIGMTLPAWGEQYFVYTPQPAEPGLTSSPDGVLVQEIKVKKGDTLSALSRKFSGRSMYYPQILLFNSIKNPNLIYAGDTLRIPVPKEGKGTGQAGVNTGGSLHAVIPSGKTRASRTAAPESEPSSGAAQPASPSTAELTPANLKQTGANKARASKTRKATAVKTPQTPVHEAATSSPPATPPADATSGQKLFETAVKAYRKDDCRTALELLDRFLANNSGSPLAADANLYKAECYLKLSAQ